MYTLEFKAWIGHKNKIKTEHPLEYFSKEFETIEEAKCLITKEASLQWNEGEWEGNFITISFKSNPGIFDSDGKKVSECKMTDFLKFKFEWIDI